MAVTEEVARSVKEINACWREGRYEELHRYLAEEAVVVMPGLVERIQGAEPIIDSYREFGEAGRIHAFEAEEPRVDVIGDTAVATTRYAIDYEHGGERYRETGADLLVFVRGGDGWKVGWRTLIPGDSETV